MSNVEAYNPFQAPVQVSPIGLEVPADKFAIEDNRILCRDHIDLPEVCISTGESWELQRFSKTLRRLSTFHSYVMILAAIFGLSFFALSQNSLAGTAWLSGAAGLLLGFSVIVLAAVWTAKFGQIEVHASWSVSKRLVRHAEYLRIALVSTGLIGFWAVATLLHDLIFVLKVPLLVISLFPMFASALPRLQIAGQRDGINILRGVSTRFTRHAVVREWNQSELPSD